MNIPTRRPRNPLHRLRTLPSSALPLALRHSFRTIRQERRLLGSQPRGNGLGGEFGDGVVAYVYSGFVLEDEGWLEWVGLVLGGRAGNMGMGDVYAGGSGEFAALDAAAGGVA